MWPHRYVYNMCRIHLDTHRALSRSFQITATNLGQMLRSNSHRTVRVRIDGFNNGRIAAVKGLTLAGIKVVSVSDVTWIDWDWTRRAKKRKRMN